MPSDFDAETRMMSVLEPYLHDHLTPAARKEAAQAALAALSRRPAGEVGKLAEQLRFKAAAIRLNGELNNDPPRHVTFADTLEQAADALAALSSAPVDVEVEKLAKEAEDGAGRFLKWTYNQPYDGPPVISIPRHDGNIDALLERLAACLRTLSRQLTTERQMLEKVRAEIEQRAQRYARGNDSFKGADWSEGFHDATNGAIAIMAQHAPKEG